MLRDTLSGDFPWLHEQKPTRISFGQNVADRSKLVLFIAAVVLALSTPGLLLAALMPWRNYLVLIAILAVLLVLIVVGMRRGLPGTEIKGSKLPAVPLRYVAQLLLGVAAYVILATAILATLIVAASHPLHWFGIARVLTFGAIFWPVAKTVALALASVFLTVPLLLVWIRYLERRDSSQDAPNLDEGLLRELARREDWIVQNHMGSIVLIKPGILRSIVIHAGHLGLGLFLRVTAHNGYLGSMRTVHFAHWAFLNNGSRLLFFSNFDHSWGSYLDDFIEKAAKGLTIAWGSGVGFPPARFLVLDGAAHGRQFKNWALASRAVTRFWYSAYRDLTVDQIERNHRIANGLRPDRLSEKEARAWMRDL
jgi:membrane protein implicated in regulation of membrane protease activity